ncbi:S-layer homology domain-containing protein [Paenibacillus turpanensis]|uniref:S-layer homology domain-containing protein n=1 Tax=Paenibacillus turpanensis TaxID=2689078 RepID=UPI0014076B37|nr:S-layer homology domain-containing protein [Paenibacillus turpanensis]
MKQNEWKTKTAGLLLFTLVSTTAMPALALGAGFESVHYNGQTVTGRVYAEQGDSVFNDPDGSITISVYGPGNTLITTTSATYATYSEDLTKKYFDFSALPGLYGNLRLTESVSHSVYQVTYAVYNDDDDDDDDSSGGSGSGGSSGGGGGYSPDDQLEANPDGTVPASDLEKALREDSTLEIEFDGDKILLPASALVEAAAKDGSSIKVYNKLGSYTLPLDHLDLEEYADKLSLSNMDYYIQITIKQPSDELKAEMDQAVQKLSGADLLSPYVDIELTAVSGDKILDLDLGSIYIERTVKLTEDANGRIATGVIYDKATKSFLFVPMFLTQDRDTPIAKIHRPGRSIYAILAYEKSFQDVQSHWAKHPVNRLSSKLLLQGMTERSFQPEGKVTRAQFAALMVRAIGLSGKSASEDFKDVNSRDWFQQEVAIAAEAGIINGYSDGTFRPDAYITREELAAMTVRALDYIGKKPTVSSSQQIALLNRYTDNQQIVWAHNEFAAAITADIVEGMTPQTLAPTELATRAQAATMLERLLVKTKLMN